MSAKLQIFVAAIADLVLIVAITVAIVQKARQRTGVRR